VTLSQSGPPAEQSVPSGDSTKGHHESRLKNISVCCQRKSNDNKKPGIVSQLTKTAQTVTPTSICVCRAIFVSKYTPVAGMLVLPRMALAKTYADHSISDK
jgi:hypothetical protein